MGRTKEAVLHPLTVLPPPYTRCVGRTKEAPRPEGERQYSSLRGKLLAKGQAASMAQQSKFAKGPDGTKGFGAPGFDRRGKPLEVAANGGDAGVSCS